MSIDIDIDCDAMKTIQRLQGMELRSKSFRPLFEYARLELQRANAENFSLGGLPSGKRWKPEEEPDPAPLMRESGNLFRSLTLLFGRPNRVGDTSAEFGTNVEYAKFHQYGTRKMASRKIVFEPRGFARDLGEKAAKYVADGVAL
jgi:phage gpG-like protein